MIHCRGCGKLIHICAENPCEYAEKTTEALEGITELNTSTKRFKK